MKWCRSLWLVLVVLVLAGCSASSASTSALEAATSAGFQSGYSQGKTDGYDEGYTAGKSEGYQEGYTAGKEEGYAGGYEDGLADAEEVTSEELELPLDDDSGNELKSETVNYIANTNTGKFHYPTCSSVDDMKEKNKLYWTGTRDELVAQGYDPCGRCNP